MALRYKRQTCNLSVMNTEPRSGGVFYWTPHSLLTVHIVCGIIDYRITKTTMEKNMTDNSEVMNHFFSGQKSTADDEFDIVFVLDRSGSMSSIRDDAIGGTNTFIDEQKKEGGNAFFSMIQFDSVYGDPSFWRKPLTEVESLTRDTFIPRGSTALFDAIGKTVAKVRELRADGTIKGKVQFVVQTDGGENASQEYTTRDSVSELVNQVTEEGWGDFIFLGANIDAFGEGSSFGFAAQNTVNFQNSGVGVRGATYFASARTKSFRYGDVMDTADIEAMQKSVAEGADIEDLYTQIDAKIDRNEEGHSV